MKRLKKLPLTLILALVITSLGASTLLYTAFADTFIEQTENSNVLEDSSAQIGEPTPSDATDSTVTDKVYQDSGTTDVQPINNNENIVNDQLSVTNAPEDNTKNIDANMQLDSETDLQLFLEKEAPAANAPMMTIKITTFKTPDGKEIPMINDDLTIEEKKHYLRQGFSIQDLYSAGEVAYDNAVDSKSILEQARTMAKEEKAKGSNDKIGSAKINWEAVDQRVKKDASAKMLRDVKGKYPDAVTEMTRQGIPADVQLRMIIIQSNDTNVTIPELIKEYKANGKANIKSKMEHSAKKNPK